MDKYAACVKKKNEIVGYLPLGKVGNFPKIVFDFSRADEYGSCDVLIQRKPVNLGGGDGMQVAAAFNFAGRKNFIEILKTTLKF